MALRNWSSGSSSLRLLALIVVSSTVVIFFQMKILFLEENQRKLGKLQFYFIVLFIKIRVDGPTDLTQVGPMLIKILLDCYCIDIFLLCQVSYFVTYCRDLIISALTLVSLTLCTLLSSRAFFVCRPNQYCFPLWSDSQLSS